MVVCTHGHNTTVQVAETVVGIAVIRWAVKGFEPLPKEFFKADFRCSLGAMLLSNK